MHTRLFILFKPNHFQPLFPTWDIPMTRPGNLGAPRLARDLKGRFQGFKGPLEAALRPRSPMENHHL